MLFGFSDIYFAMLFGFSVLYFAMLFGLSVTSLAMLLGCLYITSFVMVLALGCLTLCHGASVLTHVHRALN